MAAQERTKPPAAPAPAAPAMSQPSISASSFDFLGGSAPPPYSAESLPPPQQQAPPPSFDAFSLPAPSESNTTTSYNDPPPAAPSSGDFMWDPHAPAPPPTTEEWTPAPPPAQASPNTPSAPAYEDLLGFGDGVPAPPVPPPQEESQQSGGGLDEETMQAILAMEGMSMEEKQAMIEEQERILASIEKEKKSSQTTAADRFVQRSHAAAVQAIGSNTSRAAPAPSAAASRTVDIGNGTQVALRGQEQTQAAIKDGTAVLAQCLSCENWMQVTGNANLMFCPVCQTVSPVLREDDEAAAQLKADMELAQKLQNEEYSAAEQRDQRRAAASSSASKKKSSPSKTSAASSSSWMEYFGFGSSATAATGVAAPAPSFAVKPPERGDVGVSRPPGSSRPSLSPAQTGEESMGRVPSYEEDGPLLGSGGPAVVAQRQSSIFACVGDSISSAANSLTTALNTDSEGNVHGVDGSGLLAMSQAGRDSQYQQMGDGRM